MVSLKVMIVSFANKKGSPFVMENYALLSKNRKLNEEIIRLERVPAKHSSSLGSDWSEDKIPCEECFTTCLRESNFG